jgi:hypothetical protein
MKKKPMINNLVKILKQSTFEEAEKTQLEERTMTVPKLIERLGLTEASIRMFETMIPISSKQQQSDKEL